MYSEEENYFLNVTLQEALDLEKTKKEIVIPLSEISFDNWWKNLFYHSESGSNLFGSNMSTCFLVRVFCKTELFSFGIKRETDPVLAKKLLENGRKEGVIKIKITPGLEYLFLNTRRKRTSTFLFFRDGSGLVCPREFLGPFVLLGKSDLRRKAFDILIKYLFYDKDQNGSYFL